MHLTNYSINKKNTKARFTSSSSSTSSSSPAANKGKASGSQEKGGGNELGSKWPLTQLFKYRKLFPLDYTGGLCFELVGFDIMLDESLRAYVLEVNRNPSLNMETPFDRTLKGDVTTDTLRLVNPYSVDTSKCKHFQKTKLNFPYHFTENTKPFLTYYKTGSSATKEDDNDGGDAYSRRIDKLVATCKRSDCVQNKTKKMAEEE
eukprot:jgi/Bigna1/137946/aug1.42_g12654